MKNLNDLVKKTIKKEIKTQSKNVFDVNILHYCIIAIVLNQV